MSKCEWETYIRRGSVRRTRSKTKLEVPPDAKCSRCGLPARKGKPLQLAHKIHALNGVRYFSLTPDFLDEPSLLSLAHRKVCNLQFELGYEKSLTYLRDSGIRDLPDFLHEETLEDWRVILRKRSVRGR